MRFPPSQEVEKCRTGGIYGDNYGAFIIKLGAFRLRAIISCGQGWDHVSVSLSNRCPTWDEMDKIKRMFWKDDEVVMQLHVNSGSKINIHPFCLHLWRPQSRDECEDNKLRWEKSGEKVPPDWAYYAPIPLPPLFMV